MQTGDSATLRFTVTDADTAAAVGSGDLAVLGTPRLLAWCEAATCAALADSLSAEQTSVGPRVSLEHLAASPVGETLEVQARRRTSTGGWCGSRSQRRTPPTGGWSATAR